MKKIDRVLQEGLAFHQQGMLEEAERRYLKVRQLAPANSDGLHLLGLVLHQLGRSSEAKDLVCRAIQIDGKAAVFWKTLGVIRRALGDLDGAVAAYSRSLQLDPSDHETYVNRGGALQYLGRGDEAVADYSRALELRPGYGTALVNLGLLLRDGGRWTEALAYLEAAGRVAQPWVKASLRQNLCLWDRCEEDVADILKAAEADSGVLVTPFSLLSIPSSPAQQKSAAETWASRTMLSGIGCASRLPRQEGRIRLGYLSEDFRDHATSYLIAEVFELHNREQFEVFLYSYGRNDNSSMRHRLAATADHFVDIRDLSNEAAARLIENDSIDILVDLKGYTTDSRSSILAARPAPIQVNWLGYPGTMGGQHVDFILADSFVIPPGAEIFYSEQVIRLPHCYQPNDRKRSAAAPLTRAEYGLPENGTVFCCFTQTVKIQPSVFDGWMRILKAVQGSVLWLLEVERPVMDRLRIEAEKRGIDGNRLAFSPKAPLAMHLARYRLADMALETFPYTSHTTASDALWMGCPLVTRVGDTFASRVAGSILNAAGCPDLVTETAEQYENLVIELALDCTKLSKLRSRIEETKQSVPLFDAPSFTTGLERAYEDMLRIFLERGCGWS